jgi:hypothetical protein
MKGGKPSTDQKKADRAAKRAAMQANFGQGSTGENDEKAQKEKIQKAVEDAKRKVANKEAAAEAADEAGRAEQERKQQQMLKARSKQKEIMDQEVKDFYKDMTEGKDMGGRA